MSTPKDIAAPYMQHKRLCEISLGCKHCDCGLDQALEALSKIPPALSVVEAARKMVSSLMDQDEDLIEGTVEWREFEKAVAALSQGEAAPHAGALLGKWEDLLIQLGNKERALPGEVDDFGDALRDYLARSVGLKRQGEAVQKDEGDRLKTGAGPSAAISPKTERISAPVPAATLSRDYEALWDIVCQMKYAIGRVPCEVRGYMAVYIDVANGWVARCKTIDEFIAECTRLNLEWIAPANASAAWIPVKERLPEELDMNPRDCHDVDVWAWMPSQEKAVVVKAYHIEDPKLRGDYLYSHWMYYFTPSPPTAQKP